MAFMVAVAMVSNLVGWIFVINLTKLTSFFFLGGASYETGFCPHGGRFCHLKLDKFLSLLMCFTF